MIEMIINGKYYLVNWNLNKINKDLGTNFKRLNGCINGFKYVVIAVDNSLVYFDKDLNEYTKIYNKIK